MEAVDVGPKLLEAARALGPRIRACSRETERDRRLPEWLVQELVDAGLYQMFLPRSLGGFELPPIAYFDVVEELARIDSAVAWSILISTSSMTSMLRGLPDEVVSRMFTTPRQAIIMGSAPPKGRAVATPGGYRVTGRWTQGSNILITGWVQVGCVVYDGEERRRGPDGRVEHRLCSLPASAAEVFDTWDTTGMRGTGSHDFGFSDCFVPEERTHVVGRPSQRSGPLYQFAGWTHVGHAALGLGIAREAIEAFLGIAGAKRATWLRGEGKLAGRGTIQARVAQAEALVGSGRSYVRETLTDLWGTVTVGNTPTPYQRAVYRLSIAQAMANCVEAVGLMYSAGGASAIYASNALDRCLRDIHTAQAHVWVAFDTYEIAGRLLLGLDPGTPTI
jgi:alkylation response protein AidB-like acyl-CoA dehydrogenase